LDHRLDLFELTNRYLGERVNWHKDLKTGREWPRRFSPMMDWRRTDVGGVKYVWEINRHQFLIPIAKTYFLTRDRRYADQVLDILADWVDNNPPLEGINWTSSLELSIRLIAWTFILHLLRDALDVRDVRYKKILGSLVVQGRFIEQNLSRFSSANNHRLGEVAGLAVVGIGLPGIPEASKWATEGLQCLEEEILLQISEDGVGKEQSTDYLCFDLDLALVALALAKRRQHSVAERVWERLEAACTFLCSIAENSQVIPRVGDGDDSFAVRFDTCRDNFRSVIGTVGVLRKKGEFIRWACPLDEKIFWLAGPSLEDGFDVPGTEVATQTSIAFDRGGYYLMKADDNGVGVTAQVDCGPLGYLSIAAHGHADSLSFVLRRGTEYILTDPGTYLYQCGGRWRSYFRGTRSHNTIAVDGKDQSEPGGTFLWTTKARSLPEVWHSSKGIDVFIGSHDGYSRLDDPVRHRRGFVFLKPNALLVIDRILALGEHRYEQLYHLHPNIRASQESRDKWILNGKGQRYSLKLWPVEEHTIRSVEGSNDPMLGWYSPAFGKKEPCVAIINAFAASGSKTLISLIDLDDNCAEWLPKTEDGRIKITLRMEGGEEYSIDLVEDLNVSGGGRGDVISKELVGIVESSHGERIEIR
jgi:Heparinase II/III-like protein/Heparinase II/III N-terminus